MTTKTQNRSGGDRPILNVTGGHHVTLVQFGIKALIVRLALYGFLPASFATWLIQREALKNA
jgi:hypothetical protein